MFELSEIKETSCSPGLVYPWVRLGAAMLKRAVLDLRSDDPIIFLECVHFWLTDGPIYLSLVMGYELSGLDALDLALKGGQDEC